MNFTELLIASSISLAVASAGGSVLLNEHNSSQTLERREQLRADWEKATKFIHNEVKLAERVFDDPAQFTIGTGCGISDTGVRMAIDARRDLPLVVYGIANEEAYRQWRSEEKLLVTKLRGPNVLVRCGPVLDQNGNYTQQISSDVMIDGLDATAAGSGFSASVSGQKLVDYNLALRGFEVANVEQSRTTLARINPLYTRPSSANLCGAANYVKLAGTSAADTLVVQQGSTHSGEDMLICGFGGGDHITGAAGNEIIECGSLETDAGKSCTLHGLAGNDVLRGGLGDDIAHGGDGNDMIIGGPGADALSGGSGENRYAPGSGNDTITGGAELDVVFFEGNKTDYTTTGCSQGQCTVVSAAEGEDQLSNVEILIFRDGRIDLPSPLNDN